MTIAVGDQIPACDSLMLMGDEGPEKVSVDALFKGKKVVLFAVPGAFTPGCSNTHLPGFVVKADEIKAKGVDNIICMAVNDAFVMDAWGKAQNADELIMLADGNGDLTKAMGLDMDASGMGMGLRSKRMAMIVDDGTVSYLGVDTSGVQDSSAETVLAQL